MNGGSVIAEVLKRHGVPYLFTLCGGHISPILVEAKRRGIRVVDVRDEKNAVFAADAVARLTGIPGVAAVTAGPGLTNTVTAVQNALMAESPVIVLGGATATVLKGRGSLQDIDQMSLMRPIVKWATTVKTVRALAGAMEEAFQRAVEGVPGPVFVECPVDLLYDEATVREWYEKEAGGKGKDLASKAVSFYLKQHLWRQFAGAERTAIPDPVAPNVPVSAGRDTKRVAEHLATAKRPALVIGSQALSLAHEADRIADAVRRLGLPTYLGGTARGLLGADDPIQFRHNRGQALKEADVVIIAGFPLDFRLGYGMKINRKATLITVNRDAAALRKNRRPTLGVLGDAGRFLQSLASEIEPGSGRFDEWFERLRSSEAERDARISEMAEEEVEYINPIHLARELENAMDRDSVLVVDGGDFVATASYVVKPRSPLAWLDPGVFGTLGVGGGYALAAKLCRPSSEVWLLYGDGSAAYSLAEFDTMARHGVPVIAVIGNNGSWAQIAREQVEVLRDDCATTLARSAYHRVAEGYGAKGLLLDKKKDIAKVFREAKKLAAAGHPVVINAMITDTEFRKGSISM